MIHSNCCVERNINFSINYHLGVYFPFIDKIQAVQYDSEEVLLLFPHKMRGGGFILTEEK